MISLFVLLSSGKSMHEGDDYEFTLDGVLLSLLGQTSCRNENRQVPLRQDSRSQGLRSTAQG